MDELKNFIEKNRSDFDSEKAPADSWKNIVKELDNGYRSSDWKPIVYIGLLIVGFGLAAVLFQFWQWHIEIIKPEESLQLMMTDDDYAFFEEYKEVQQYYTKQVGLVLDEINELHHDAQLEEDLRQIDDIDAQLRLELKNTTGKYRQDVIRAMIFNQQNKLTLLESIYERLLETNENKNYEKI